MATRLQLYLQQKNGGNQSEMARFVGVSPQAVQKWMSGDSEPRGKNLDRAAEFLGISAAELKFGSDAEGPAIIAVHPEDPLHPDMVYIPESRIQFSAGNGHVVFDYEIVEDQEPASYKLSFFQKNGMNPNRVKRFRATGDSMAPNICDGDAILVNLDETDIIDGKTYAIRYGESLRVKKMHKRLDGTLVLQSINPAYRDEEIPPHIANEQITIVGRVRDRSGTGGL